MCRGGAYARIVMMITFTVMIITTTDRSTFFFKTGVSELPAVAAFRFYFHENCK